MGENEGIVTDVYANNLVEADLRFDNVCGLVGRNLGRVERGFAVGHVTSLVQGPWVGGLVGANLPGGTVVNSVWGVKDTRQQNGIGVGVGQVVGKTRDGMRGKDFFDPESYIVGWVPGWDFTGVWIPGFQTPDGLPQLRNVVEGFTLDTSPELYMVLLKAPPWYALHIPWSLMSRPLFPGTTTPTPYFDWGQPLSVTVMWNGVSIQWTVPITGEPLIGAIFDMPGENPMVIHSRAGHILLPAVGIGRTHHGHRRPLAAGLIRQAAEQGWVSGYGNGTFRPDSPVTREEFVVFLGKSLGICEDKGTGSLPFVDKTGIAEWAQAAVEACVQAGILRGYEDGGSVRRRRSAGRRWR